MKTFPACSYGSREIYHISSLKVQKLLVTAGVYQPVKKDANYYTVKALYESGKSADEIIKETGLAKATVNGFLPYERGIKNADDLGVEITNDTDRKRRQRSNDEMKKENARNNLSASLSQDALWNALIEHDQETFITEFGVRFHINALFGAENPKRSQELIIHAGNVIVRIPRDEVMEAFHNALEIKATGEDDGLGKHDEYLRPVFVFFGILPGDVSTTTTRRAVPEERRCSCCGRKTDHLYTISTFEDLVKLDAYFDEMRKADWTADEKDHARVIEAMFSDERAYWEKKNKEKLETARASRVVADFNHEGVRRLCEMCCHTIYDALKDGDIPPVYAPVDYSFMSVDELEEFIITRTERADCDYYQVFGNVYRAGEFDDKNMFLFRAIDTEGVVHRFALTISKVPYGDGDNGILYRALEVHRLTKAGKIAKDNSVTDYDVEHFKMCHAGEDVTHSALVGLIELMEKVAFVITAKTLRKSYSPASNNITIAGKHYGIESIGTIKPVYVGDVNQYLSMKGRNWEGGDYGFLIDGKLFSGEELALMFSNLEGFQLQYYAEDNCGEVLKDGEILMRVGLNEKTFICDTTELLNIFTEDGRFVTDRDKDNFETLFLKNIVEQFKVFYESKGRGHGKLAGMGMIKVLKKIDGTEDLQEIIREVMR